MKSDFRADPNSEDTSTRYDSSGIKTVTLTVTDDDHIACCGEGPTCEDKSDTDDEVEVTVVGIASLDLADPNAATLIDDGDDDDDTLAYVVGVADSGYLVVEAVPDPNVEELPECWTLTGGDEQNDKRHSHVDITQSDKITVTCTAGTESKSVTIYVVKVDIQIGGGVSGALDENEKENPGKYINVNWNDNDKDGWTNNQVPPNASYTGDKSDPNIDGGDSDFRPFIIALSPDGIPDGEVILTYDNKIKIWETNTKKAVDSDLSSGVSSGTSFEPNEFLTGIGGVFLYMEGCYGSEEFRDVDLMAKYSANGKTIIEDLLKITVFEVTLDGLFGFGPQQPISENDKRMDEGIPSGSSNLCGRISYDDKNANGIKDDPDPNCDYFRNCMECEGTVDPNGVTVDPNDPSNEITFDFDRHIWQRIWRRIEGDPNWILYTPPKAPYPDPNWASDESTNLDEDLTPSSNNHIYHIDAPGLYDNERVPSFADYIAVYQNFRERVIIYIEGSPYQCSNYYKWHSVVYVKPKDATYLTRDSMSKQKLGGGWVNVPMDLNDAGP